MKRLLIAVVTTTLLSGCAAEAQREAKTNSNSDLLYYTAKLQDHPTWDTYTTNRAELTRREQAGLMSKELDDAYIAKVAQQKEQNKADAAANGKAVGDVVGGLLSASVQVVGAAGQAMSEEADEEADICLHDRLCRHGYGL
ncbi:hypothetical protein [Enterobacter hormaechei]|uniref:hypothetical protein n=1 Tax=Enterobacter hormaechei TaxID=158836 RepID=UPI002B248A0F|nr:hypothetical protein [Enterobacter hormaechei]